MNVVREASQGFSGGTGTAAILRHIEAILSMIPSKFVTAPGVGAACEKLLEEVKAVVGAEVSMGNLQTWVLRLEEIGSHMCDNSTKCEPVVEDERAEALEEEEERDNRATAMASLGDGGGASKNGHHHEAMDDCVEGVKGVEEVEVLGVEDAAVAARRVQEALASAKGRMLTLSEVLSLVDSPHAKTAVATVESIDAKTTKVSRGETAVSGASWRAGYIAALQSDGEPIAHAVHDRGGKHVRVYGLKGMWATSAERSEWHASFDQAGAMTSSKLAMALYTLGDRLLSRALFETSSARFTAGAHDDFCGVTGRVGRKNLFGCSTCCRSEGKMIGKSMGASVSSEETRGRPRKTPSTCSECTAETVALAVAEAAEKQAAIGEGASIAAAPPPVSSTPLKLSGEDSSVSRALAASKKRLGSPLGRSIKKSAGRRKESQTETAKDVAGGGLERPSVEIRGVGR